MLVPKKEGFERGGGGWKIDKTENIVDINNKRQLSKSALKLQHFQGGKIHKNISNQFDFLN